MKYFKIENRIGYFYSEKEERHVEIDRISKEDIIKILQAATNVEVEFDIDETTDDGLNNPAHQIIYAHLTDKFKEILEKREQFYEESKLYYKDALDKYRSDD